MNARVKVIHEKLGEYVFPTRDISDGGIFIALEGVSFEPTLGDRVVVQVQGLPVPAPVLNMVVVRKTDEGYGLQFALDAD
jgi:hypothetical protein